MSKKKLAITFPQISQITQKKSVARKSQKSKVKNLCESVQSVSKKTLAISYPQISQITQKKSVESAARKSKNQKSKICVNPCNQ
jgi:hypothetical protein